MLDIEIGKNVCFFVQCYLCLFCPVKSKAQYAPNYTITCCQLLFTKKGKINLLILFICEYFLIH